jgi:hypothetical protein
MQKLLVTAFALFATCSAAAADEHVLSAIQAEHAGWIESMKQAERGPFKQIRWFCKDGQVLPPRPYGCQEFGGGSQHGEWSERTQTLRAAGYFIANFYADLDTPTFVANHAASDRFAQMLIEQFLVRSDDGWILRRARFYRGAYQAEGERLGARKLLLKLAEDPEWLGHRYLVMRSAARLLDHGRETASAQEVRQLSASLSDRDPNFRDLRVKIHGSPELADAQEVRRYATNIEDAEAQAEFIRLAGLIEQIYTADIGQELRELAAGTGGIGDLAELVTTARTALGRDTSPLARSAVLSQLLADLRDRVTLPNGPRQRLQLIDASLAIEAELFTLGAASAKAAAGITRAARLGLLRNELAALFGTGLISRRQFDAAVHEIDALQAKPQTTVGEYKATLDYLALVPNWGTQNLRRFFGDAMTTLGEIEPKASLFIQDYLRGSPMFHYAVLIDEQVRDANTLAGVRNELFGDDVGARLRSLNPGLARGTLHLVGSQKLADLDPAGIYLLPETASELPPIAGILTEGEGNPLSHVQLLARNLGIPNVGVDQSLLDALKHHAGDPVVLAVSPAGSVRLALDDGSLDKVFADEDANDAGESLIRVDLDKLDLDEQRFLTLSELRATDSGRVVGPKAAKLGELKHHYPEAVAEGLAIPFGVFRRLLAAPMPGTGGSVFDWMQTEYRRLAALPADGPQRRAETEAFRARLQETVLQADPGDAFRARLRAKLSEVFGADGHFGVFVRSDTNVEDLPGFTGAGLNLTVANVVGIDNIFAAISRVWASPFSARSFAWRQTLMDKPEHVYPAVLLMRSVDADKSGVLVTQDIDSGDGNWLSVAVNEGVGGAVDGQSAESLRIDTRNSDVRLMAAATAPIRRKVDLTGGVRKLPVSTADRVLRDDEVQQLVTLARDLPTRFPEVVNAAGKPAPADIEFGFLDGKLALFQIRPFLDSDKALGNAVLRELDAPLAARRALTVKLDEIP